MIRTRLFILLPVMTCVCALPAFASSLVDAANREKARRANLRNQKSVYVLTNDDLQAFQGGMVTQPEGNPEPYGQKSRDLKRNGEPDGVIEPARRMGEALDRNGNGESYWRHRLASAENRLSELESRYGKLQSEIPRLRTAFVNTDDPAYRRVHHVNLEKAMEESKKVNNEISRAKADVALVHEEGRRAGALPGWLR